MSDVHYPSWAALGVRPELAWIEIDKMIVDESYQRDTQSRRSRSLIDKMAREFSWRRFQPLIVTRRPDGRFAIIDGQHKREAAILVGLDELPCMVVPSEDVAEEAEAFVSVNGDRVAVTSLQVHWSKVVARDPKAMRIKAVCDEAGVTISRYPLDNRSIPPKTTMALGAIEQIINRYGDAVAVDALTIMAEAFPEKRGQLRAGAIKGLAMFFAQAGDTEIDWARLRSVLAGHDMSEVEMAARAYRQHFGGTAEAAVRAAIIKMYNRGLGEARRLKEAA